MNRSYCWLLVALILAAGAGAGSTGGGAVREAKDPKPAEPGRFLHFHSPGAQNLLDTTNGKFYGPKGSTGAPERRWSLLADSPSDLAGVVAKNPRLGRFHYSSGTLVDTATGRTYELVDQKGGQTPYKWLADLRPPGLAADRASR